jgi:hypothetical protein
VEHTLATCTKLAYCSPRTPPGAPLEANAGTGSPWLTTHRRAPYGGVESGGPPSGRRGACPWPWRNVARAHRAARPPSGSRGQQPDLHSSKLRSGEAEEDAGEWWCDLHSSQLHHLHARTLTLAYHGRLLTIIDSTASSLLHCERVVTLRATRSLPTAGGRWPGSRVSGTTLGVPFNNWGNPT